jgi:5-amino-6-(5-phospho-D-ribitylamino)uracil phosphatase
MEKYIIALDLDGTLMTSFNNYDIETFEYIKKLHQEGHIIVLATGRPYRSTKFVYDILGLDTPMLNYNGAIVTNPMDPSFPKVDIRINKESLCDILYHTKGMINAFCEIGDDIFVNQLTPSIEPYLHLDGGNLIEGQLCTTLTGNPNGALVFIEHDLADDFEQYVLQKFKGELLIRHWPVEDCNIVEVFNPNTTKGNGLAHIASYYNIPTSRIIAIGDGHNDIEMLAYAGISVAMKNSHPELFPHATIVTDSNKDQGVLKFLQSFFHR